MNCAAAREAISAGLDGEALGVDAAHLAAHLEACAPCRAWRERAHVLTRRVRVQAAPPLVPPAHLVAYLAGGTGPTGWRLAPATLARLGLVVVGVAQLVIAVPALLLGHDHAAPVHVAHEMGSLEAAVGLGFLVAARRPLLAAGMRALMGAAAVLLVVTAVFDLLGGRTALADEAGHLVVVAGWLLLCRVATVASPFGARRRLGLGGSRRALAGRSGLPWLHRAGVAPTPERSGSPAPSGVDKAAS